MPKRVIDFDALWASDKLAACAEWAQCEYAWLYGLADASGSFEMGNLRVIWGRVAAIRKNLTLERLGEIFDEFIARGLLFTWEENGKRYGHWTGSDVPGRLPPPSWRMRLEKLAPPVPRQALAAYSAGFGGSREGFILGANAREGTSACAVTTVAPAAMDGARIGCTSSQDAQASALKAKVEEAQAQDWDLDLNLDLDLEKEVSLAQHAPQQIQERGNPAPQASPLETAPEELLAIYEAERGALPPAHILTAERRSKCAQWLAEGFTAEDFRAAVRRAAKTPFLAGAGELRLADRRCRQRAQGPRRRIRAHAAVEPAAEPAAKASSGDKIAPGETGACRSLRGHRPASRRLRRARQPGGARAHSRSRGAPGSGRDGRASRRGGKRIAAASFDAEAVVARAIVRRRSGLRAAAGRVHGAAARLSGVPEVLTIRRAKLPVTH
jgi:hypothetical protein